MRVIHRVAAYFRRGDDKSHIKDETLKVRGVPNQQSPSVTAGHSGKFLEGKWDGFKTAAYSVLYNSQGLCDAAAGWLPEAYRVNGMF
eukprot:1152981-Pelagomonas_calceolata.AAC.1